MSLGRQFFLRATFLTGLFAIAGHPQLAFSTAGTDSGCAEFIKSLPAEFEHGFISVPEKWSKPNGRQIKVFYYGNFRTTKKPIIYINGGPAASSGIVWTYKMKDYFDRLQTTWGPSEKPGYLFFDQRGTGCSSEYPSDILAMQNYASDAIAQDVEALRKSVLGPAVKPIIWGQSYGSIVAMRYYRQFAQFSDKVVTTGQVLPWELTRNFGADRLRKQYEVLQKYYAQFPEDRERLQTLLDAVDNSARNFRKLWMVESRNIAA